MEITLLCNGTEMVLTEKMEGLRGAFGRRWDRLLKSSRKHRVPTPDKEALWGKLVRQYEEGFKCSYCNQQMLIKDSAFPPARSFSIDHKTSLFLGGTNSIDNLEIVCHRCNLIKGTMKSDTFMELIGRCPPSLLDKMFSEVWGGRLAEKLNREESLE